MSNTQSISVEAIQALKTSNVFYAESITPAFKQGDATINDFAEQSGITNFISEAKELTVATDKMLKLVNDLSESGIELARTYEKILDGVM